MPRWVESQLTISGDSGELDSLAESLEGTTQRISPFMLLCTELEPVVFSLEQIDPTPAVYLDNGELWSESREFRQLQKQFRRLTTDQDRCDFASENPGFVDAEMARRMREAGRPELNLGQARSWRLQHWGTDRDCVSRTRKRRAEDVLVYDLTTASNPPLQAIARLARQHPTMRFRLVFYRDDDAIVGETTWVQGCVDNDEAHTLDDAAQIAYLEPRWPEAAAGLRHYLEELAAESP